MKNIKKVNDFNFKSEHTEESYLDSNYIIAEKIDFSTGESKYNIYVGNLDKNNLASKELNEEEVERFFLEEAFGNAVYELLNDDDSDKFIIFTEFAEDCGEIPATIQDAKNILEWDGDICLTDEYGRVFSRTGVYLADMILLK